VALLPALSPQAMCAAKVAPSLDSYNALVGAYSSGAEWQRAITCLEVLKRDGLTPDGNTYGPQCINSSNP
jgi:pentatricopeptide repeat protein